MSTTTAITWTILDIPWQVIVSILLAALVLAWVLSEALKVVDEIHVLESQDDDDSDSDEPPQIFGP